MSLFTNKHLLPQHIKNARPADLPPKIKNLLSMASYEPDDVLVAKKSKPDGLTEAEAKKRINQFGYNEIATQKNKSWLIKLFNNLKDPLSILLFVLAVISFVTKDVRTAVIISAMVVLSVGLRFIQELRADKAVEKLKALIHTTATVIRNGKEKELPTKYIVPGDIIHLSAGDIVPADLRIISSKDLFVNQSALTGESLPIEKHAEADKKQEDSFLECINLAFFGTSVESGTATAVALATGSATYFGSIADDLATNQVEVSSFDKGIKQFTWLMIKLIMVLAPLVFLVNGLLKGSWLEAFLFAIAITVGLTPEMLPMIVTVNLSKGAIDMSRRKVIVKRLSAIQNFGAMDILCTDKTGTITQGKVILEKYLDIDGQEDKKVLSYGYINSYFQTGLKNLLDDAVLSHKEIDAQFNISRDYKKIDEIPFDFERRRMSVVVADKTAQQIMICKGAVEEMLTLCQSIIINDKAVTLDKNYHEKILTLHKNLSNDGFRVMIIAFKKIDKIKTRYAISDENNLSLLGFLCFWDPPKPNVAQTIGDLSKTGVMVKILTGDNELVTHKICQEVGLKVDKILLGRDVDALDDVHLKKEVENISVFARLAPNHKERVIKALRDNGHVVGYMGDGINDAPALRVADVGISVDTGVDIAKESSDIILLEKKLSVLKDGVMEGRKIFGNITKYIRMAASSNFGNMFSVVGGSIFLPFLPMLPLQILTNNMLYDFSQTTIPTDKVDEEYVMKPRKWDIKNIKYFIFYIGPISSIFDYLTYLIMLVVFHSWNNPALFHTGWFIESIFTQTLIIHIIRTNKIPFVQSRASWQLIITSLLIVGVAAFLPYSPIAHYLGFVSLPALYWCLLAGILVLYFVITQAMKSWFIKKYETN